MAKQSVAEDKSEAREPRGRVTQRTGKTRVVTAGEPGTPPAAPAESRARVEAKPEPAGRPDRASRAERPERAERTERAEKPERAEKSDRAERPERNERADSRDERREDGRGEQGAASGQPRYEQARQERFDRAQGSQGGSPGGPSGERGSFERGPTDRADRGGGGGGGGGERGFDRPDRAQGQGYPGAQGGHGGPGGGGGGGGGGGEYRDRFQDRRDFNDSFGRRKRKKKRRGGGGDFHAPWGQRPSDFMLPSDEELEREAAEIEKAVAKGAVEAAKGGWTISALQKMDIEKLHKVAEEAGLEDFYQVPKQELVFKILKAKAASQGLMMGEGTLEIMPDKFGFLRSPIQSYLSGPDDIYVSPTQIRRYGLKKGMVVKGLIRPPKESERYFALLRVDEVNGRDPKAIHNLSNFEDLTPLHPEQRYILETTPNEIEMRIVDLVAPIGKGQRALIVAPPRTGKTVLMQKMTKAISTNFPDAKIFVLLVDERPEEVTDFRRNCAGPNIEVVASTFDEQSARHLQVAEMVIEKARRMVEFGEDVVILLDSITRLARAYNTEMPHSGKIGTGGIDVGALQRPKKFFGSARAIENGGSLTIIGTALVDTGSKADEVIFEEFKGTGNSELHLDRKLVEKRIYPAIDVAASGTRREELLMDKKELELVYRLRKVLSDMNVVEAMELMKARLGKVKTNAEFLMTMNMG